MEQYELLKELRKEKHIKAVTIADKLQISQSYLSEIENGKKKLPLNLLNQYAEIFQTKTSILIKICEDYETFVPEIMTTYFPDSSRKTTTKKYIMTNNTKRYNHRILHQIQALTDFGNVKAGDLGGWIEKYTNLSQHGLSWVDKNAMVYGQAKIRGKAQITDNAVVYGTAVINEKAVIKDSAIVEDGTITCDAVISEQAEIHHPLAFVSGTIKLHGNINIKQQCYLSGDGDLYQQNHLLVISPIGQKQQMLTFFRQAFMGKQTIYVNGVCGLTHHFFGSIEQFDKYVHRTDADNLEIYDHILKMANMQILNYYPNYVLLSDEVKNTLYSPDLETLRELTGILIPKFDIQILHFIRKGKQCCIQYRSPYEPDIHTTYILSNIEPKEDIVILRDKGHITHICYYTEWMENKNIIKKG